MGVQPRLHSFRVRQVYASERKFHHPDSFPLSNLQHPVRRAGPSLCILLLLLLRISSAFAQAAPFSSFARRAWFQQDGLPESTVQAFSIDREGYLWIGTTGGLVRFDGHKFIVFNRDSTPALPENSVFCLLSTSSGSLLIGTEGGGLVELRKGDFRHFAAPQGLTDGFVRSLLQDSQGRVWIGTDNGLFLLLQNHNQNLPGRIQRVTGPGLEDFAVHAITEDRDHRIWVGGSKLLAFSGAADNWNIRSYLLPGVYSQNRVKSLLVTSDGTLWVGTVGGLVRLQHGVFQAMPKIAATVRALTQTGDSRLLIGTIGDGLWGFKDGRLGRVADTHLLPSRTVLAIHEDALHQVWIGTQDGMLRLSATPVQLLPLPGASDPDFETISCDPNGAVWVASSRLYRIDSGIARPYDIPLLPGRLPIRNVFRDRDGALWAGTDGDGVYHVTPNHTTHLLAPKDLTNNFIRGFLQASDGSLWVGTDEGVNHIDASGVHRFQMKDGLAHYSIRTLIEDRHRDIWIGTEQGVSHWHAGAFVQDHLTRELQLEKVWSVFEDSDGDLWFGTRDHGLFRSHQGHLSHFTTAEGLASNSIYQILEDGYGALWLSSPNRIFSLDRRQIGSGGSRSGRLSVTTYPMPYGADGAQMYGGRQPAGCMDPQGALWFASTRGAMRIQPAPALSEPAPPVMIDGVSSDGHSLAPVNPLILPAHATRIAFDFSALLLRPQDDLRLRYKLEPLDRNWTLAGAIQTASYTNLPAGRSRFRVQVFETGNPSLTRETSLDLRKLPHFYQTWWFASLVLLAALLTVWLIYRARMHQLKLRFEAVLAERTRLAREMHDTVIQGCTSVSALLEAIACSPRDAAAFPEELLGHARTQVRTTIEEAREAVWDIRHSDAAAHDLKMSIGSIAAHTEREFSVPVVLKTEGAIPAVHEAVAHELLMVVREAVYNAVLHASPKSITILLAAEEATLRIEIRDDGSGFDAGTYRPVDDHHYGLTGMKERVRGCGGTLQIASGPGSGTLVVILLKLSYLLKPSSAEAANRARIDHDSL